MAATKEGTTLQAQATRREADGVSGSVTLSWRGTITELESLAVSAGMTTGGHKWSIEPDNDVPEIGTLSWTIATGANGSSTETDDPISTDWQLDTPSEIVPLSEHPDWTDEIAALLAADEEAWNWMMSYWAGEMTYDEAVAVGLITTLELYPFLEAAVDMKREGVTGYFRGAPTLTVVDRYQRQAPNVADTATVNIVYTTSQLVSAFTGRTGDDMPSDISSNLATGEWLCESVTRRSASDGSREVTQTFRFAPKWRDALYDHAA